MAKKTATSAGMTMRTIQAPSWNFVTAKTRVTTAVSTAPTPLITIFDAPARVVAQHGAALADLLRPGASWPIFHQRRVMPAWDRVKDRNTPIA